MQPTPSRKKRPFRGDPRPGIEQIIVEHGLVDAPVHINEVQRRPSGEAVIPDNVKRTVQVAPPGRFALSSPVAGGFAAMKPGQYLDEATFSQYVSADEREAGA